MMGYTRLALALAVAVLVLVSSVDGKDRKRGDEKEGLSWMHLNHTTSDLQKGNRETAEKKNAQHASMKKAGIKPEKTSNWVGNNSVFFGAEQDKQDQTFHPKKKLTALPRPLAKEPPISADRPGKMLKLGNERNALRFTSSQHGQDKTAQSCPGECSALHKKKLVAKDSPNFDDQSCPGECSALHKKKLVDPPNFDNLPFKVLKDSKVEEHPEIKVFHRDPTQTFDERKHRGPPLMMPGIKHAVQGVVPVV